MLAGVLVGDFEVALEDRQLTRIDVEFVVVVGQRRRLIGAVSAAEMLKLRVQRSKPYGEWSTTNTVFGQGLLIHLCAA